MKVTKKSTYVIELSTLERNRLARALQLALAALPKVPAEDYSHLVSMGTVDKLLALKTALFNAEEEDG